MVLFLNRSSRQADLEHFQTDRRLIGWNHVSPIDDLLKDQTVASPGHTRPRVPVVRFSIVKFGLVVPLEILGPGFVAQIIDNRNDPKTVEHVVLWKILWK